MKRNCIFIFALFLVFSLSSCNEEAAQQVIGTYSSSRNGSIEITSFDGDEGEFKAYNIILPRLNDGYAYTTPSNAIEIFAIARSYSNYNQLIKFSIDGVAYIATFSFSDMTIEVEGANYEIQK